MSRSGVTPVRSVYSSSLTDLSTARTRIERQFELEAVRQLKETSGSDLSIGGAGITAEAFRHGRVDECVLLLCPVLVGGGKPALPRGVPLDLELLDHLRFDNGVIYVRHAVRSCATSLTGGSSGRIVGVLRARLRSDARYTRPALEGAWAS
jgi:dihydrofolate reductase